MKKLIIAFILGGVVFGSITGVIALSYTAKDVTYTPSDNSWNVDNVEDAIKDLKVYKDIGDFNKTNFGDTVINNSYGNGSLKTTSLELEPGNYLINVVAADAFGSSDATLRNSEDNSINIECNSNDCSYKKINSRSLSYRYASNNNLRSTAAGSLYLVNIKSRTTVSSSYDSGTSNNSTHTISMYMTANKIN